MRRLGFSEVVDPRDVAVREASRVVRLRTEPGKRLRVACVLLVEHFDRDRPLKHTVVRPPHLAESA